MEPTAKSSSTQSSALTNGLALVECLASKPDRPQSLADLAESLGLPHASALRLLRSLCEAGYVRRDEGTKRYTLTSRFSDLGVRHRMDRSFVEASVAPLRLLRDETEETAQLLCLDNGDSVILDQQVSTRPFKFVGQLGSRTPWQLCAPGKAMAASLHEDEFDALLARTRFSRTAPRSLASRQAALAEILRVREQGWALDDEEHIEGLRCVGAAVCDLRGRLIGGLTVAGFKDHFEGDRLNQIVAAVLRARNSISRAMQG